MAGQPVLAAPAAAWLVLEVDTGPAHAFESGHLPGAAYLDTGLLEGGPLWNVLPDGVLLHHLLELGIRLDSTVIVYDRNIGDRQSTAAARAAQLLLYAGVSDVRLLDGGLAAWLQAGLPLVSGPALPSQPATDFGLALPGRPDYLIGQAQAKALLTQPDGALVSIRSWEEFSGQTSGYSYITAKGDIAGARWGHAGESQDINDMSTFQTLDSRMRPAADILAFWAAEGIHPGQQTAFYCGTGWRASLAFFYAWLMGWERISVYDGGWLEWSQTPA